MLTYGDALHAFRMTFNTDNPIKGYPLDTIHLFCYGWLTAKGVPCDILWLYARLEHTDQIVK